MNNVGSEEWIIEAEKAEWAFVAQIMREMVSRIKPGDVVPSYWPVAITIAEARSIEGWRAFNKPVIK